MWEITDNTGTIHSGTEEEMKKAFDIITNGRTYHNYSDADIREYDTEWDGDLKLIQIHNTYR